MRRLALFLVCGALWAADADFNGRWDITVHNSARGRAWWLQVEGAGGGAIKGKFIGFPGGDLNDIQHIWIENGELRFTFEGRSERQEYQAKLDGGKLEGSFQSGDTRLTWTGARAPEINDADDGSWHEGQPVELLNRHDVSNWHGMIADASHGWSVDSG